ncbi:MAG TPA: Smr/MutS family protein [Gammaproteobacteria bacterium]|nr:Smr/MutS family protein [Gammaproteobacteria bacterium]
MSGNDDDRDAFAAAMRGVKPLRRKARTDQARTQQAAPRRLARRTSAAPPPPAAASNAQAVKRLKRSLRRGELTIGAELDLHGATAAEAPALLDAFLDECRQHGVRCARVIHGKGRRSGPEGPVLKGIVHERLARAPSVLGLVPAEPHEGGSGAVLVLLRR